MDGLRMVGLADRRGIASCIGLAALWLCMQSSGFFPLTSLPNFTAFSADALTAYHLLYSVSLIIIALVAIAAQGALAAAFEQTWFAWAVAVIGVGGHLLLGLSPSPEGISVTVVLGVVGIAAFTVIATLFWTARLVGNDTIPMMMHLAASYVLAQLLRIGWMLLLAPDVNLFLIATVISAACIYLVGPGNVVDDASPAPTRSIRQLSWGLVVPALVLVYFCELFVHLHLGGLEGEALFEKGLLTPLIAAGVSLVIFAAIALFRKRGEEQVIILVFAGLVCAYVLALLGIVAFGGEGGTEIYRPLVVCAQCVEVFLWMMVLRSVNTRNISAISAFGAVVIFVVALPKAITFDAYRLLDVQGLPASNVVPLLTAAVGVLVVGLAIYLLAYAFRGRPVGFDAVPDGQSEGAATDDAASFAADAAAGEGTTTRRKSLREVLAPFALTKRELEVAEYLYRGYSAKKIAEVMFLSEASIRAHTSHIYRKMELHTKQEFITYVDLNG